MESAVRHPGRYLKGVEPMIPPFDARPITSQGICIQ